MEKDFLYNSKTNLQPNVYLYFIDNSSLLLYKYLFYMFFGCKNE